MPEPPLSRISLCVVGPRHPGALIENVYIDSIWEMRADGKMDWTDESEQS